MKQRVLIPLLCLAFAACSDDSGNDPGVDAGMDTGVDATGDVATESCDGVTVAESPGETCGGFTPCGEGLQCSRLESDEAEGICRQVCVPGTCESVCREDEACVPLTESPGTGVCASRPTGERGAYEECSEASGFCAPAFTCLVGAADATSGVCLPGCVDDACPPVDGRDGQCVIRVNGPSGEQSYCAPSCSGVGADDECPGDMRCYASGAGFVCAFAQ